MFSLSPAQIEMICKSSGSLYKTRINEGNCAVFAYALHKFLGSSPRDYFNVILSLHFHDDLPIVKKEEVVHVVLNHQDIDYDSDGTYDSLPPRDVEDEPIISQRQPISDIKKLLKKTKPTLSIDRMVKNFEAAARKLKIQVPEGNKPMKMKKKAAFLSLKDLDLKALQKVIDELAMDAEVLQREDGADKEYLEKVKQRADKVSKIITSLKNQKKLGKLSVEPAGKLVKTMEKVFDWLDNNKSGTIIEDYGEEDNTITFKLRPYDPYEANKMRKYMETLPGFRGYNLRFEKAE